MGLIRNLTADEIISQLIQGIGISRRSNMPPLRNVVFMGMGDAGRNLIEVGKAVDSMADRDRLSFAKSKITISTVGPSPEAFMALAAMPGSLAWSLHAADNDVRRQLVPSTRHSVEQLRDGFVAALASRASLRSRTVMIALTLVEGINDSLEHAERVARFIQPIYPIAPNIMIDLIPYNDISVPHFSRPSIENVNRYQQHLRSQGVYCSVRITRGDEEFAACGMLATTRSNAGLGTTR
jgi:23S rRNA (adenine2503-C2)-methyltransferase